MSIFSRLFNSFGYVASSETEKQASDRIDILIDPSYSPEQILDIVEKKTGKSMLDIRKTSNDQMYSFLFSNLNKWYYESAEKIPPYEDQSRDIYLSSFWRKEPILAGAVYSMTAKMTALRWSVIGRRKEAREYASILAEAAHFDGYSWDGFCSSTASDFYTTNRGVFWETPRNGNYLYGKLASVGHVDALNCTLTGNKKYPVRYYSSLTGQQLNFRKGEYIHFASMPSPREDDLGRGFCAVDRAFRASKILLAVYNYDEEKLANLPPEGIASVTGLTMDEFMDALNLWRMQREADKSLTFPQVLWLVSSQPNAAVGVDITGFSSLPESFDRKTVIDHYISTLALDFGVDAREFWPISSGALGTASESEIQHLKAKGKGPGEFISTFERHINGEFNEETHFSFDTQDIEEDIIAATIAKSWIDAYYPLYVGTPAGKSKVSPGTDKPNTQAIPDKDEIPESDAAGQAMSQAGPMMAPQGPEQVLTKEQLMRILADKQVLPEWMLNDERLRVEDNSIHISKQLDDDEFTSFEWYKGVLKEVRLPAIELRASNYNKDIPFAQLLDNDVKKEKVIHANLINGKVVATDVIEKAFSNDIKNDDNKYFNILKQMENDVYEQERDIRGNVIPSKEVTRGSRITKRSLESELERWRSHPILSKYAPTLEELEEKLGAKSA